MRRLAKPVISYRGSEGSNPSLSAISRQPAIGESWSRAHGSPSAVAALRAGLCIVALLASCAAQRELVVTSDPPGAIVRLDERIVGMTPYRHLFEDYGSRRLTLYRTGYRTLSAVVKLKPPWYAYFPLDYISEVLIPVGWRDTHEFQFTLEPDTTPMVEPDVKPVLERAERLRRAGPEGPEPPKAKPKKTEPPD
jgi:hypothetical protein